MGEWGRVVWGGVHAGVCGNQRLLSRNLCQLLSVLACHPQLAGKSEGPCITNISSGLRVRAPLASDAYGVVSPKLIFVRNMVV